MFSYVLRISIFFLQSNYNFNYAHYLQLIQTANIFEINSNKIPSPLFPIFYPISKQTINMHYPVMLSNTLTHIQSLKILRKAKLLDCNFGLGGHSNAILNKFHNIFITAYDLDSSILERYRNNRDLQKGDQSRLRIVNQNYTHALKIVQNNQVKYSPSGIATPTAPVTGIKQQESYRQQQKFDILLADLGFNSVQLQQNNGFSWKKDSPLDMKYNDKFQSCSQMINRFSIIQLIDILIKYGDLNQSQAKLAAKAIKQTKPTTTYQLRDCTVGIFQQNKTRKIAQIFQAFRIATNHQLQSLKQLITNMHTILNKNALVMLITFHSKQRDLVYKIIKDQEKQRQRLYTKIKIQYPSQKEIQENSRSKSAQMLVFRRN